MEKCQVKLHHFDLLSLAYISQKIFQVNSIQNKYGHGSMQTTCPLGSASYVAHNVHTSVALSTTDLSVP